MTASQIQALPSRRGARFGPASRFRAQFSWSHHGLELANLPWPCGQRRPKPDCSAAALPVAGREHRETCPNRIAWGWVCPVQGLSLLSGMLREIRRPLGAPGRGRLASAQNLVQDTAPRVGEPLVPSFVEKCQGI